MAINRDQGKCEQQPSPPSPQSEQSTQQEKEKVSETTKSKTSKTNDKILQFILSECNSGQYKMKAVPIDLWDFGGQKIYYMTHQLFISSRGIFIIIFNGSKSINKEMSDLSYLPGQKGKKTAGNIK